jgi:membrane protein DedA with SNARE-associated domain
VRPQLLWSYCLTPSIAHLIHDYGLVVVAAVIGLESVGFPFPGESVLILASIFAGTKHELNIVEVVLTAASAAVVGQMIGYVIGREFGYWLLLRYGTYLRITESRIKLGEYLFLRHGGKIIIVARFVPLLRALAGILAGANRMPWRQFMLANVAGAALWASAFGFASYMLGRQVEHAAGWLVIVVGIAAAIVIAIGVNFVGRHEAQLAQEAERALPGPLKWP